MAKAPLQPWDPIQRPTGQRQQRCVLATVVLGVGGWFVTGSHVLRSGAVALWLNWGGLVDGGSRQPGSPPLLAYQLTTLFPS